jgi:hypothetical protein
LVHEPIVVLGGYAWVELRQQLQQLVSVHRVAAESREVRLWLLGNSKCTPVELPPQHVKHALGCFHVGYELCGSALVLNHELPILENHLLTSGVRRLEGKIAESVRMFEEESYTY